MHNTKVSKIVNRLVTTSQSHIHHKTVSQSLKQLFILQFNLIIHFIKIYSPLTKDACWLALLNICNICLYNSENKSPIQND